MLTQEYLQENYIYDSVTGDFISRRYKRRVGNMNGKYLYLRLFGKDYPLHRIIWLYYYGQWPTHEIDHIDRNPLNNSLCNLRDVPRVVNISNRSVENKYGFKGVRIVRRKDGVKYQGQIRIEGKIWYLGMFDTPEEAHNAFKQAHLEYYRENSEFFKEAA